MQHLWESDAWCIQACVQAVQQGAEHSSQTSMGLRGGRLMITQAPATLLLRLCSSHTIALLPQQIKA